MKLRKLHVGTLVLALVTATTLATTAQACGWSSGCAQRTTEGVFREYGPRVPDSVRRGADYVRRGAGRAGEELRFLGPNPRIGRNGLRPPHPRAVPATPVRRRGLLRTQPHAVPPRIHRSSDEVGAAIYNGAVQHQSTPLEWALRN